MDDVLPKLAASGTRRLPGQARVTDRQGRSCRIDRSPDPPPPAQSLQHRPWGADHSAALHRELRDSVSSSGCGSALDVRCVTKLLGDWRINHHRDSLLMCSRSHPSER